MFIIWLQYLLMFAHDQHLVICIATVQETHSISVTRLD